MNTKIPQAAYINSLSYLIALFFWISAAHSQEIKPRYMSISDGITSPTVQSVMQDSYGYIWVGTNNGLQKYDGYNFETFKHDSKIPGSLLSKDIWHVAEDSSHQIWIGCVNGVSRFNRKTKTFTNYNFNTLFNTSGSGGRVYNLKTSSDNRIWALSAISGPLWYNEVQDIWQGSKYIKPETNDTIPLMGTGLTLTEDTTGGLYYGSLTLGLLYKPKNETIFHLVKMDNMNEADLTQMNGISYLFVDSTNVLWLTTRQGVYKYYPSKKTIKNIITYDYREDEIINHWNCIKQDQQGNVWVLNNYRGILRFNGISDTFVEVPVEGNPIMANKGYGKSFTEFTFDKSGIMWIGSLGSGLLKYDPAKNPFEYYKHNPDNKKSLSNSSIFSLYASKVRPGILYVGTKNGGLNIYNTASGSFTKHVKYKVKNDTYGGAVRSIGELPDGSLLLGTWGDGLIELDKNFNEIKRYTYDPDSKTSIPDNNIRVIKSDDKGGFWLGTTSGLCYLNPQNGNIRRIQSKMSRRFKPDLLAYIDSITQKQNPTAEIINVEDNKDLSTPFKISEAGEFVVLSVGEGFPNGMADYGWIENENKDTIWSSFDFSISYYAGGAAKNRYFIETIHLNKGNYTLHYKTDDSHSYNHWNAALPDATDLYGIQLEAISATDVQTIANKKNNTDYKYVINGIDISTILTTQHYLWIGTRQTGLNKLDLENNVITHYQNTSDQGNTIPNNNIQDLYEDNDGMIWITTSNGIAMLDPETNTFTRYGEEDGLPTNLTSSILPGENGNLWISTQSGISQMIRKNALNKATFINYNANDGLGGDIYVSLAAAKTPDGKLWFGGEHGLNGIGKFSVNNVEPDLVFNDFLISNKSVFDMEDKSLLPANLNQLKEIKLNHTQNNLSFEFAALHYSNPQKNQYAHMLKGYDADWSYDNRNFASYTNLKPGSYEFMVRASNAYGVWNDTGKSLHFVITPPWWIKPWAIAMYVIILLVTIYLFNRFMQRRIEIREREKAHQKELAQAKEIEKAYNELKSTQAQLIQAEKMASLGELTAGIAHEIQNPLNFVNNFADVSKELLEEMKTELKEGKLDEGFEIADDLILNLDKISHHGKRAESIVKGMLLHSRGNSGEKKPTDINALADEYLRLSYHGLRAKDKSFNADFKMEADESIPEIMVAPQDMGRVILNLVNNAFYAVTEKKKSDLNGYKPLVTIQTKKINQKVEIIIKDNGNGIPAQVKAKIFQPFFTTKPTGQGTGLGLSLSYDIVKANGGELSVESMEGEGCVFNIQLPVNYVN